jgi:hypothetical protein
MNPSDLLGIGTCVKTCATLRKPRCRQALYQAVSAGILEGVKIDGRLFIRYADLKTYLERREK